MSKLLSGKIFWADDDFNYNAVSQEHEHTVTKIENVIIEDYMIEFLIPVPKDLKFYPGYTDCSYKVNLTSDTGLEYRGTYKDLNNPEYIGPVNCDKFCNEKRYFLYGEWIEQATYTWWAIIEKY